MYSAVSSDSDAIKAVLNDYSKALNASNTDEVVKLYHRDGILMAQHFPTVIGIDAVRGAYGGIFKAIQLTVEFQIEEVVVTGSEWAFARTSSAGKTLDHASGAESAEGNQELFVFRKEGADWKIARYCFCTMNLPK